MRVIVVHEAEIGDRIGPHGFIVAAAPDVYPGGTTVLTLADPGDSRSVDHPRRFTYQPGTVVSVVRP